MGHGGEGRRGGEWAVGRFTQEPADGVVLGMGGVARGLANRHCREELALGCSAVVGIGGGGRGSLRSSRQLSTLASHPARMIQTSSCVTHPAKTKSAVMRGEAIGSGPPPSSLPLTLINLTEQRMTDPSKRTKSCLKSAPRTKVKSIHGAREQRSIWMNDGRLIGQQRTSDVIISCPGGTCD